MSDRVTKFIESLEPKTREHLKKKLLSLKVDPYNSRDIKKLQGYPVATYRLRMGKIRIVYQIKEKVIEIIDIDYRGNIY
ncbi:type II toxin-antitoxin system RelE/ParE family toxin [Candidatus Uhrbacteria bacterium]|nr:type II toxin-antitoxin system RelE/ParE family toxin [Candidatus Uhrbacteria bacterium]